MSWSNIPGGDLYGSGFGLLHRTQPAWYPPSAQRNGSLDGQLTEPDHQLSTWPALREALANHARGRST